MCGRGSMAEFILRHGDLLTLRSGADMYNRQRRENKTGKSTVAEEIIWRENRKQTNILINVDDDRA